MKTIAIVQARLGSTRFPKKVLKKVCDKYLIQILLHRLSFSKLVDHVILATTENKKDDELADVIRKLGYTCFRGSENNVLDRYYQCAKKYNALNVVRVTGDCPLIDPTIVDKVLKLFFDSNVDYASNVDPPTYPDGLDVEVFSMNALKYSIKNATTQHDKEHVTPYIKKNSFFKKTSLKNEIDYSKERWTVDEKADFKVVEKIIEHFNPSINFGWKEVIKLKKEFSDYFIHNQDIKRNEGSYLGKGQKLYKRAKVIIPGGTMLLSKRPEMFLPEKWPSYYKKSKGCKIWDLDNICYKDVSIMGIGTNILGYGNKLIDDQVNKVVRSGNMSTFNCPEEVELAEKLISIHPWAHMVRLARSGGEANSIAIRIARAFSGKDKVAICGYHGWHDWYLSANLNGQDDLNTHLLPGLSPNGVPKNLKGSTLTFKYNDFDGLKKLIYDNKDLGTIKMEVMRNIKPENNFLKKVRDIAKENKIILIFDECTSGFRETFGGLHKKFNVEPDLAMFGKALGNGYAITAVIGKGEIMEAAQSTFISSTFWTERIGPSAAVKTLEVMEKKKSWNIITKKGKQTKKRWTGLAKKHDLSINITGIDAMPVFSITSKNWLKYKTYITQEMLKHGFLATNTIYFSTVHTDKILDEYFDILNEIFLKIKEFENGKSIDESLEQPVCHSGFNRLN